MHLSLILHSVNIMNQPPLHYVIHHAALHDNQSHIHAYVHTSVLECVTCMYHC